MCRLRAQIVVVRIETAGGFSFGTFHFSLGHAGGDCANHAGGYLILQLKDVLKCSVISVCPQMRAGSCINQLTRYPDRLPDFRTLPSRTYRTPKSRATCLISTALPLNVKLEFRAMTNSCLFRERAVMISSTMPSAKYSCSGSPLMFWNGSTAMDGLSGRARVVDDFGREAACTRANANTCTGRAMFLSSISPLSSNADIEPVAHLIVHLVERWQCRPARRCPRCAQRC